MKKQEVSNINRQTLINELVKSHHGALEEYVPIVLQAAKYDPEFLAHLIVWNLAKGEIRDSKIALPIIHLRTISREDSEFAESAVASLLTLDPRSLVKAYKFNKELVNKKMTISGGHRKFLEVGFRKYLEVREANRGWWDKTVIQHKKSMKSLYAVSHFKPNNYAQAILFDNDFNLPETKSSIFQKISQLRNMDPNQAAGVILNNNLPFQIVVGALGKKKEDYEKDPALILALLEGMSGQQLISQTKLLSSMGVLSSPMLKSEYDKALGRASKDKKFSTLKAGKAIEKLQGDESISPELIAKLTAVQDSKISQKTIEGDWLVLGDCSGSMEKAVDITKYVASYITKSVQGKVYMIFFNTDPRVFDVTGKSLEEIKALSKHVRADGGTSCGCGIKYLQDRNISINGIAIISDGGDNTNPYFHTAYLSYVNKMGIEPETYFFRLTGGNVDVMSGYCQQTGIHLNTINSDKMDYYSLPNVIATMKTGRYSLVDEIMNTPLLTFNTVFA